MSYSPLYYVAGIGHLKLKEWRENCSQKEGKYFTTIFLSFTWGCQKEFSKYLFIHFCTNTESIFQIDFV